MKTHVYVGNWDIPARAQKGGISHYLLNEDGSLSFSDSFFEQINVGNLLLDKEKRILYVTDERDRIPGASKVGGEIYALKIEEDGSLNMIGHTSSYGSYPSYMALSRSGNYFLVTNLSVTPGFVSTEKDENGNYHIVPVYDEANVVLFERNKDGSLGKVFDIVKHEGSGAHVSQTHPRPHSIVPSPDGRYFLVCDKGNDNIYMYRVDEEKGKLIEVCRNCTDKQGSAPRYSVFHPKLPYLYHNNELLSDICAFSYDDDGKLSFIERYSFLPQGYVIKENAGPMEVPAPSDIIIDEKGKHLYAPLRICNTIAVFNIREDGRLTLKQNIDCGGNNPRSLKITPDGRYLLVCNIDSREITTFSVLSDGSIRNTGISFKADKPANLVFF